MHTQNHLAHGPGRGRHHAGLGSSALAQNAAPKIAVTDLAWRPARAGILRGRCSPAQRPDERPQPAARQPQPWQCNVGGGGSYLGSQSVQASEQASGTYVAGTYSYIEQRELGGYTNDNQGACAWHLLPALVQARALTRARCSLPG